MEIEIIRNYTNNIAEILTGYDGKGIILYSPLYGNVELIEVRTGASYPIKCRAFYNNRIYLFAWDGRVDFADSECLLYPAKDQRDWSKFKAYKAKPHKFKPFDKVLVRDYDDCTWECDFFGHIKEDNIYGCVSGSWKQCIPYEGNEHLLGTKKKQQ